MITLAVAKVGQEAHKKNIARQSTYAQSQKELGEAQIKAEQELEKNRKDAIKLAAVQAAMKIREQKQAQLIAAQKQQIEIQQKQQELKQKQDDLKQKQIQQIVIISVITISLASVVVFKLAKNKK